MKKTASRSFFKLKQISQSIDSIEQVRHFLIDSAISICFVIAFPAIIFSAYRAKDVGWQNVLFIHVLIAIFFIVTWSLKGHLSYKIKGLVITWICFVLGVSGLLTWGLIGMGATVCMIFCITAGIFFGPKYGFMATALVVCIMCAIAVGFISQRLTYSFDILSYSTSIPAWGLAILGTGFLSCLVTISFQRLLVLLFDSFNQMKQSTIELQKANGQLKTEMDLRIQSDEALVENKKLYLDFLNKLPDMVFESRIFREDVSDADKDKIVGLISTLKETRWDRLHDTVEKTIPNFLPYIDGSITFANKAALSSLGYSSDEMAHLRMDDILSKEYHGMALENLLNLLSDQMQTASEYKLIKKSGKNILISLSFTIDCRDYPFIIRGVMKDISRQRALELNMYKSQRRESIGTLAGGIAHDFRNILSAILGYAEMTKMTKLHPNHPALSNIEQIIKASKRADGLIEHILTFSKQTEHKRDPIQIAPIIQEAVTFIKASLPSTVEIKEYIYDGHDKILADPTQIYQVMINLCTNASHAMRSNGGLLNIILEKADLTHEFTLQYPDLHPGKYVKLTVEDNGHGIPKNIIESIFDPYFTTKEKSEGTGLGLAVVHGIVKNHKGEILVKSVPEKGSTFTVFLPIIASESKQETDRNDLLPTGMEHILFVDDDPVITELGKSMLTFLGYSVITLNSSTRALEVIKAEPGKFDLVITDLIMPNMTGIELSEEIKDISDLPVILCTGNGHKESTSEERLYAAGIYDIIVKPLFMKNMATKVRDVLDRNRVLNQISS